MRAAIEAASKQIAGHVRTTPIIHLEAGTWGLDAHLVLKLEHLQQTGSFKPRGAFNRILLWSSSRRFHSQMLRSTRPLQKD